VTLVRAKETEEQRANARLQQRPIRVAKADRTNPNSGFTHGGNNVTIVGILVVIILVLLVIYLWQRVR
jgi:hypothetical protein